MCVPLAEDIKGMRISYKGLLTNAAATLRKDADGKYYRESLDQLRKHLEELAERYYSGDLEVVDEFLQLYRLGEDKRKKLVKHFDKLEREERESDPRYRP